MLLFSVLQGGLQGWQPRKAPEPHGAGVVWGSLQQRGVILLGVRAAAALDQ